MNQTLLRRTSPEEDESLYSFMERLAKANHYKSRTWLEEYYGLEKSMIGKLNPNISFGEYQLKLLSNQSGVDLNRLYQMTLHKCGTRITNPRNLETGQSGLHYLNYATRRKFGAAKYTKYCPHCLKSKDYHRLSWDITSVTACLKHNIILNDSCPICGKKITISMVMKGKCKCGTKLAETRAKDLNLEDIGLEAQQFIQNRLSVYRTKAKSYVSNPALSLNSPPFFILFNVMCDLFGDIDIDSKILEVDGLKITDRNILSKKQISNLTKHIVQASVFKMFLNWPSGFIDFINEYRNIEKKSKNRIGFCKDFLPLTQTFNKLTDPKIQFVKETFNKYLLTDWDGGLVQRIIHLKGEKEVAESRYLSAEEASCCLGVSYKQIVKLYNIGKITGKIISNGSYKLYLIDRSSITALNDDWSKYRSVDQEASGRDTTTNVIQELINEKLFSIANIEGTSLKFIFRNEIDCFC